jgi:FkbM family methyltransferase
MVSPRTLLASGCMAGMQGVSRLIAGPAPEHLQQSYVLSGPLRGMLLAFPRLERPAMVLGRYERHVVALLRTVCKPGMVAYDVGAHVGYLSLVLSRLVRKTGQVLAFEPNPPNRQALLLNVQRNGAANVGVFETALSDETGVAAFATFATYSLVGHLAGDNEPGDATIQKVQTATLDDFVFQMGYPAPAVMKMDVEGAELRVLTGAQRVLGIHRPVVVAEVRANLFKPIRWFMQQQHYRIELLHCTEQQLEAWGLADMVFWPE